MRLESYGASDSGVVRENNEDAMFADDETGLYVVCDGMGGHASGEAASACAVEAVKRAAEDQRDALQAAFAENDRNGLRTIMTAIANAACADVFHLSKSRPDLHGMGTTLTVALVRADRLLVAHIGDSRLYLLRGGEAHRMTSDHTIPGELLRSGAISPAEAAAHPLKHVLTKSLGRSEAVISDALVIDLRPGDRFLLCSDGLSEYVPDEAWLAEHCKDALEFSVEALVEHARNGGGHDNITALLVEVGDDTEGADDAAPAPTWLGALSDVPMFTTFSFRGLGAILGACELRTYAAGETIVREGDLLDSLIVLLDGIAEGKGATGERTWAAPCATALTPLLLPRAARTTVTAKSDVTIATLSQPRLRAAVAGRPWLATRFHGAIARELARQLDANAPAASP